MFGDLEQTFWNAWGGLFVFVGIVIVALVVLVLIFRGYRASLSARTTTAGDERYHRIVEEVAATLRTVSAQSERSAETIAGLEKRLAAVEGILRQVE